MHDVVLLEVLAHLTRNHQFGCFAPAEFLEPKRLFCRTVWQVVIGIVLVPLFGTPDWLDLPETPQVPARAIPFCKGQPALPDFAFRYRQVQHCVRSTSFEEVA